MNKLDETMEMAKRNGKMQMLVEILKRAEVDGKYWKLTNKQIEDLEEWVK